MPTRKTLIDEHGRVCTKCLVYKTWDCYYKRSSPRSRLLHHSECRDCYLSRVRPTNLLKRQRIKRQVIDQYGGFCACCGETEIAFLTIDHMNNDGAQHRREVDTRGLGMYYWLRRNEWPAGFQVLCWNCNLGRQIKGTCPHASGLAGLQKAG